MEQVAPTDAEIAEIVRRLGFRERAVRHGSYGLVNHVYFVGNGHVLRIPRNTGWAVDDALTESVAVPVAVEAGLKTPSLVAFDCGKAVLPVPIMLYQKARGSPLGLAPVLLSETPDAFREAGRQLGLLHQMVNACPDPNGFLDSVEEPDCEDALERCARSGHLDPENRRWIEGWVDRLSVLATPPGVKRFLHYDAHEMNLLVDEDYNLTAVLDWGDAAWGDPAADFENFPAGGLAPALEGYAEFMPVDQGLRARILIRQIWVGLNGFLYSLDPVKAVAGMGSMTKLTRLWRFAMTVDREVWCELLPGKP